MNFIKEIFNGKVSESSHRQFVRFGKGEYRGRAILGLWKTAKGIKLKSSFEFVNNFVLFAAELEEISFSGSIWSKDELPGLSGKKKEGKIIYEVKNINSSQVKSLADKAYYFLLSGEGSSIKLKIKGKLPKPGKGEGKVDEKFCQMEMDEKYYKAVKDDFFWDMPEGKKISVVHRFIISEIIPPKEETLSKSGQSKEKDFAKIREMAKRSGKIIRIANVDGKESKSEIPFEA